jgi:predicted Zn-dependent peptidase
MKPAIKKTILDNGIRIITKKMPHIRSVSMGVWVNVGARDESQEESGISHLIEHMIFKGTAKRSAFQIAKEFDAIGGNTNAFTSKEHTCYHARVLDVHMEAMVDILSDIFLNSVFDALEVEKERPVIFQEIGMVEDSPEEYIHILSGNTFWGDHPLGRSILGTRENILRFDADAIKRFFSRYYSPQRIVISAAGNVDHNQIVDLMEPSFKSIPTGDRFPERLTPSGRTRVDIHHRDLEQVHVCIGTPGMSITDPRRYAFSLMNTILGGNMSSRLFQQVRESRGLAYSVYSFISSHVDTGMFGVYVGVDSKKAFESTQLILNEMRKIKEEPVDVTELHDAIEYTKGSLLLASESTDNQMVRLAQNEIHFGRYIPLQSVVEKIESVSTGDILEMAKSLFQPPQIALTLLGPIRDQKVFEDILMD